MAISPTRYTLSALSAAAVGLLCTSCSSGSQLAGSPEGSTTTASTSVSTVIVVTTTTDPRALAVQFGGISAAAT